MLGRNILSQGFVPPTRVTADGVPEYKAGGITIDWSTVAALGSTFTFPDTQFSLPTGTKFLRYGQVISKIVTTGQFTLTETGSPTGGTYTLVVTTPNGTVTSAQTTGTIAQAALAATVQTTIAALSNVGAGNVTVTGSAGGPWTVNFANSLGSGITVALGTNSFTGGSSPNLTVAQTGDSGGNTGWFGPFDPSATDGRQLLNRGDCFILDETLLQYSTNASALSPQNVQTGGAIEGGLIFLSRIIQSGVTGHSLSLGPTLAEFTAAFPRIRFLEGASGL